MAFHDWNGDGKKGLIDDAAEFYILHSSSSRNTSSGGCGTCFFILLLTFLPWILTALIMMNMDYEISGGQLLLCLFLGYAGEILIICLIGRSLGGK